MSAPLYKHFNLAEVPPLNEYEKEIDTALFSADTIIRQQNMDIINRECDKNQPYKTNHDDVLAKDIADIKTRPYMTQGKTFDSLKVKETIRQPVAESISQNNPKSSFSSRLKEAKDRYNQPSSNISMPYSSGPKIL